ncbi:MAG: extracellular solute-binding protein [Paenibacillaceae bacterium]|nr:extracellular solute-binding protein [Paenibacillaceae bacterium]
MKRTWTTATAATLIAVLAAGCGSESGSGTGNTFKSFDANDKATIKVAYMDAEAFNMQYGNLFKMKFPNVTVEVVSTRETMGQGVDPAEAMEELLDKEKPDLVMLTPAQYEALAADGKLAELEAMMKRDKFDLDDFVPAVTDLLRVKGGGKLYGMAPTFGGKALYYNKDLFDKYGVPYPTDQMSWEDVLQLARRFPTDGQGDARIYGLHQPSGVTNPFELATSIGMAKGLAFVDYDNAKLSVNNADWNKVAKLVADAYKSGSVSVPSAQNAGGLPGGGGGGASGGKTIVMIGPDTFKNDVFLSGRAAMMVDSDSTINLMGMAGKVKAPSDSSKPLNWDVVTMPVDASNPDVSSGFTVGQIVAIPAQAANPSAAWELWKFINGGELAKMGSQGIMIGGNGTLPSRKSALQAKFTDGRHMEAFYKLKADESALAQKYPAGFLEQWNTISGEQMKAVISGGKTVEDALKTMQDKGQEQLSKTKLEEKNKQEQKEAK